MGDKKVDGAGSGGLHVAVYESGGGQDLVNLLLSKFDSFEQQMKDLRTEVIKIDENQKTFMISCKEEFNKIITNLIENFKVCNNDIKVLKNENEKLKELLSPYYAQLFKEVKQIQAKHRFKYVWFRNCRIFIRVTDGALIESISSFEDLQLFLEKVGDKTPQLTYSGDDIDDTGTDTTGTSISILNVLVNVAFGGKLSLFGEQLMLQNVNGSKRSFGRSFSLKPEILNGIEGSDS
uniref:FP protein C-terminal domain-containing protein n=1 Tax=Rhodnius prolixus TaxID=13249 RepID=T1I1D9_RHOPR